MVEVRTIIGTPLRVVMARLISLRVLAQSAYLSFNPKTGQPKGGQFWWYASDLDDKSIEEWEAGTDGPYDPIEQQSVWAMDPFTTDSNDPQWILETGLGQPTNHMGKFNTRNYTSTSPNRDLYSMRYYTPGTTPPVSPSQYNGVLYPHENVKELTSISIGRGTNLATVTSGKQGSLIAFCYLDTYSMPQDGNFIKIHLRNSKTEEIPTDIFIRQPPLVNPNVDMGDLSEEGGVGFAKKLRSSMFIVQDSTYNPYTLAPFIPNTFDSIRFDCEGLNDGFVHKLPATYSGNISNKVIPFKDKDRQCTEIDLEEEPWKSKNKLIDTMQGHGYMELIFGQWRIISFTQTDDLTRKNPSSDYFGKWIGEY